MPERDLKESVDVSNDKEAGTISRIGDLILYLAGLPKISFAKAYCYFQKLFAPDAIRASHDIANEKDRLELIGVALKNAQAAIDALKEGMTELDDGDRRQIFDEFIAPLLEMQAKLVGKTWCDTVDASKKSEVVHVILNDPVNEKKLVWMLERWFVTEQRESRAIRLPNSDGNGDGEMN